MDYSDWNALPERARLPDQNQSTVAGVGCAGRPGGTVLYRASTGRLLSFLDTGWQGCVGSSLAWLTDMDLDPQVAGFSREERGASRGAYIPYLTIAVLTSTATMLGALLL